MESVALDRSWGRFSSSRVGEGAGFLSLGGAGLFAVQHGTGAAAEIDPAILAGEMGLFVIAAVAAYVLWAPSLGSAHGTVETPGGPAGLLPDLFAARPTQSETGVVGDEAAMRLAGHLGSWSPSTRRRPRNHLS